MNLDSIKNRNVDLFHPIILVGVVILFLIIAVPMWYYYAKLPVPSLQLYVYIFLGILFFILGILFTNYFFDKKFNLKNIYSSNVSNLSNCANLSTLLNSVNSFSKSDVSLKLSLFDTYSKKELIFVAIVSLGILLQVVNLVNLGGIPLFSAALKARAATKIWLISYIVFLPSINILLSLFNRKSHYVLLCLGILLFSLTGYRTTPIAILLSIFITLYYTRNIKFKHQVLFVVGILAILISIGFIAVQAISWQHWSLNPIELVSYRAAFTLNIFERAINIQGATMGSLFYSTLTGFFTSIDPRVLVGQAVLGINHSITSTIFGPALLDFGIVVMLIQMFGLGFILKSIHTIQNYKHGIVTGIYGVLLAQTIIWVETGPTDLVVWIFYMVGILIVGYIFYRDILKSKSSISNNGLDNKHRESQTNFLKENLNDTNESVERDNNEL